MSRGRPAGTPRVWKGAAVVLVLVVIVTVAAGIPWLLASEDAQRPPADPQLIELELPPGTTLQSLERAEVFHVVDGDTIDVRFEDNRVFRLRYFGVDTPTRGDACFREAVDRNEMLLEEEVLLLQDERAEDGFGRLLRYVFLEDGTSIDATLVAEGFGEAWRSDGRYLDEIVALEEEAQAEGRGCLWGDD